MPGVATYVGAVALGTAALLYRPVLERAITLGAFRRQIENIHGVDGIHVIPGTTMCEDLHREFTTNQLFTACQLVPEQRDLWFPPTGDVKDPKATDGGALLRIDPVSMTSINLKLNGFSGPFVTHGIDILNDPDDAGLLWIFAVNHLPNPERWDVNPPRHDLPIEKAHIEIFSHRLGTDEADHVRSVAHPDIRLPNDLLAITPKSFYATNDHVYYTGPKRIWEDVGTQHTSPTPDTVFIEVADLATTADPSAGVTATVALHAIHNNNGLSHGNASNPGEIVVIDASGGVMVRTVHDLHKTSSPRPHLNILERIQTQSTLDNPSYYDDPWKNATHDASGYILPGLGRGYTLAADFPHLDRPIPSLVWHVRKAAQGDETAGWEQRLVFQDDGHGLRSASGAVLIGIDPAENEGRKQGWLFVTGFGSLNAVAVKIDL